MASIFYANDQGEVIVEAGKVLNRVGQVLGAVTDLAPDVADIAAFTYNNADDQGLTAYTKQQRAASRYLAEYFKSVAPGYDQWANAMFVAPASGVIRMWGSTWPLFRVNGTQYSSGVEFPWGASTEVNAGPWNVAPGDVIDMFNSTSGSGSVNLTFLPFVYPVV